MNIKARVVLVLFFLMGLVGQFYISHNAVALAQDEEVVGCVNFEEYADGDELDPEFEIDGVHFTSHSGDPFVVTELPNGEKVVFFSEDGVWVKLPTPAMWVTVRAGSFSGAELEIIALDSNDNPVDDALVLPSNSIQTIQLHGVDITSVIIAGGDNEGALAGVCFDTERPELPDLSVQINTFGGGGCPGGQGTCTLMVEYIVTNTSSLDVMSNFDVLIEAAPLPATTRTIGGLAAGTPVSFTETLGPGNSCFNPDCTVRVTVDFNDDVAETSEGNNVDTLTILG